MRQRSISHVASSTGHERSGRFLRRRGDRAASLIEFALVLPVFALLLLGMIDFGFAYGDYISVRNGSREGARLAAVNVPGTETCTLDTAANAATQNIVCLTKDRVGLNEDDVRVSISFADSTPEAGESVTICVNIPATSRSGMTAPFLSGRGIQASTEMRLEDDPAYDMYSEGGLSC